jgi:hypothetical protein
VVSTVSIYEQEFGLNAMGRIQMILEANATLSHKEEDCHPDTGWVVAADGGNGLFF